MPPDAGLETRPVDVASVDTSIVLGRIAVPSEIPVNQSSVFSSKCVELTDVATASGSGSGSLPRLSCNVSEMLYNIVAGF